LAVHAGALFWKVVQHHPEVTVSDPAILIASLRLDMIVAMFLVPMATLYFALGVWLISVGMALWNRGRDEGLLVKLARAALANLDESAQNTTEEPPA
jgi:hypothetical protein